MSKLKLKKIKVSEKGEKMMTEESPAMFPPSFHVDSKQMSEVEDHEVGSKYKFVIEVELKSKSEREKTISSSYDIVAYRELKKKKPQDMNDEEFEEHQGDVMSGKVKL